MSQLADSQTKYLDEFWANDWDATAFGPPETWRSTLKWSVDFVLSSKDPLFLIWGDSRSIIFNRSFAEILGESYADAQGAPLDRLWAAIWDKVEPYIDDAYQGSSGILEEMPLLTWASDFKETCYYTFSYTPLRDRNGSVLGASCTVRDITNAVRSKQRTEKERDLFYKMFESAPGFIAMGEGPEHRFVYANASYKKFVGREDLIGKTVREVMPEIIAQGFVTILDEVYRTGEPFVGQELPIQVEDQSGKLEQRYIDTVYQPVRDATGRITGIFAEGHDVTEHRLARDRLAEAEQVIRREAERFKSTLDHIPQMVWSTRPDGYHDYYSGAWYEFTGAPAGSTDGEAWNEMFHPDDQPRAWEVWRRSLKTGQPYEIEYRLRHKSGEYRWVLGRAWAERNSEGDIVRWYGTCTDIHDRVVAEEKVARLQAEVVHLARINAMGTMAATLAHEVNQPLAAAANFLRGVDRMIERGASVAQIREPLAEAEKVVHRAGDVIRRLRQMSTPTRHEKQEALPNQMIDNARKLAEAAWGQPLDVQLHLNATRSVLCDPVRIEQVLINLIKNAAEAMVGQEAQKLSILTSDREGEVFFCVSDSGPGIEATLLPHLFDAFRSTKEEGIGIGLSVSRTIIEEHDGKIWAENNARQGAEFCFTLPVFRSSKAPE